MNKRIPLVVFATIVSSVFLSGNSNATSEPEMVNNRSMTVFKSPSCGCCAAWVEIMSRAGFEVEVRDMEDMDSLKKMAAIPEPYWACHSAKIGNYIIEGHVPAEAIEKLTRENSDIRGIAVPGMPMGAPGMGNDPQARYDVVVISNTALDAAPVYMRVGG